LSGGKEKKRAKSKSLNSKEQVPSWLNQRKERRVQWVRDESGSILGLSKKEKKGRT